MNNSCQNISFTFSVPGYEYMKQLDWIIPVTVNIILTTITLWVLICLVDYGRKTGKWRQIPATNSDNLNAGLVYTSVVVCACACVVRYAVSLLYMNVGFGEDADDHCDAIADTAVCFYAFVLFSVFLFLWFRQRVFYRTYVVRSAFHNVYSCFSSASIGLIFIAGVGAALLNVLPINHRSSVDGCIYIPDESQRMGYLISVAVAVFIGQVVLLGLFIYPLQRIFNVCHPCCIDHKQGPLHCTNGSSQRGPSCRNVVTITTSTRRDSIGNNSVIKLSSAFRRSTTNLVKRILRRTFIFALLSLSSDIFLLVFSNYIVQTHGHRRIPSMIYDVNSFLNLLLVVLSFVQYKEMVTSPCRIKATNRISCKIRK